MSDALKRYLDLLSSLNGQLLFGVIGSIGIKFAYVAIQFALSIILARLLGPEGLGVYAFTIALVQLLAILSQFGFPVLLVRYVAALHAKKAWGELKGLIKSSRRMVILTSGMLIILFAIAFLVFNIAPKNTSAEVLVFGLFLVPLLAINAINGASLCGFNHVVMGQIPEQIVRPLIFFAILFFLGVNGIEIVAKDALIMHIVAAGFAVILGIYLLSSRLPPELTIALPSAETVKWLKNSAPFLLVAGIQILNYQMDIIMLGIMTTSEQTGHYRVAIEFGSGMAAILIAISTAIAPTIAKFHAQNNLAAMQRVIVQAHRLGFAVTLVLGCVVIYIGEPLVTAIFGEEFTPAVGAIIILVVGRIVYATVVHSGVTLSMCGEPWVLASLTFGSVCLNFILNVVLIPRYGINGAAVATAISAAVVNIAGIVWLWRMYGRNMSIFGRLCI